MKKLSVHLTCEPETDRLVGELAERNGRVYFEYDAAFLQSPLWLSPFKLPPEPGLLEHRDLSFGPVFGLFDDSLPDGWGLLLMDRFFRQQKLPLAEVSILDRLAYLGSRTMGALTYHPPGDCSSWDMEALDLHEMAAASEQVLAGTAEEVLPQLMQAGGSPGGARPKVLVGIDRDRIVSGAGRLAPDYEPWLIKFSGKDDLADAGPIEFAYSLMARAAGIDISQTRLFETDSGERFFGTRRFDRVGTHRYHVHTFGNLIHSNFRIPACDYAQLLKITHILTRDHEAVSECYRRMVFNVLTHNRDDHVKNFAFRLTDADEWELAPAYDLMFADGPGGEHSMTIAGEGKAPGRKHLLTLGTQAGMASADAVSIVDNVADIVTQWSVYADQAGVSAGSNQTIGTAIKKCLNRVQSVS